MSDAATIGERFAVKERGQGPPLILVHGFGCDQAMWDRMVEPLAKHARVITYDLAGMGDEAVAMYDRERHAGLGGHAEDLVKLIESMGLEKPTVVGHSVAASIVAIAANRRPELIGKIVMLSPSARFINDGDYVGGFEESDIRELLDLMDQNYVGWAGHLAGLVAGPNGGTKQTLDNRFCRNDPSVSRHFAQVTFTSDNRDDFRRIRQPTLIVQCAEDHLVPETARAFLAEAIPHARQVLLPVGGHAPHMNEPEATAAAIAEFLDDK